MLWMHAGRRMGCGVVGGTMVACASVCRYADGKGSSPLGVPVCGLLRIGDVGLRMGPVCGCGGKAPMPSCLQAKVGGPGAPLSTVKHACRGARAGHCLAAGREAAASCRQALRPAQPWLVEPGGMRRSACDRGRGRDKRQSAGKRTWLWSTERGGNGKAGRAGRRDAGDWGTCSTSSPRPMFPPASRPLLSPAARSYIPQRWLLYCFTAPAIIYILCQISDYTPRMRVWVIMLNVFMLAAGGLGTVPWISWTHKGEG